MQWVGLSLLALAMRVAAQTDGFDVMSEPEAQKTYAVGSTLPITWAPGPTSESISLTLIGGAAANSLNAIVKIASGINSTLGTYPWLIPDNVGTFASYGINLTSDANPSTFQYSNAFHISGGSDGGAGGGTASTTTGSSSSTSASASAVSTSTTTGTGVSTVTSSSTQVDTSTTTGSSTTGTSTGSTTLATTKTSSSATKSSGSTSTSSTSSASASSTAKSNDGDMMRNSKFALFGGLMVAFTL